MNEKTKRILLITLFALSVVAIATALYFMFFRSVDVEPLSDDPISITDDPTTGLPTTQDGTPIFSGDTDTGTGELSEADEVAQGDVTQTTSLTQAPVFNTILGSDGNSVQFYDQNDGRFYTINEDGEIEKLSDRQFPNLETATWNNNSEKAVLEFPDGSNIVYNFETEVQTTLPKHWEDFDFSPSTDEIVAKSISTDPNNRWLVTSNDNGSNVTPFQALGENADKVDVNWSPNDQVVAFADTAGADIGFGRKMIIPVGKNSENFQGLVVEGYGFSSSWAPNGRTLLYSVSGDISNNKPLLWTVSATSSTMGENRRSLNINTWVEKCTWESDTSIYCAVPRDLPDNAGLQSDLYNDLADNLYKINLDSGSRSLVAIPETDKAMTNLSLSNDGSNLFFTDANTGNLELIKLK